MVEVAEEKKVEIMEPVIAPEPPTRDQLKTAGWSSDEMDRAEKRGMVKKAEEKKEEQKIGVVNSSEPTKTEEQTTDDKKEEKPKNSLPDFSIDDPVKEKAFLDAFGPGTPHRGLYFRMKNERQARQRAQDEARKEREARVSLEARLSALEGKKESVVDENGNVVDPEDKPLTIKQLREMQKQELDAIEKQKQEKNYQAQVVVEAQKTQEEYARSIYPDFDDAMTKAADVMKNVDSIFSGEKWKQAKAIKLMRDLQVAAANANKLDLDEYHGALIAYEIGQLHPQYGKPNGAQPKSEERETLKDPKANGGLTPEQMKRIEENTQRRASSASIPGGGGKRTISADDVGLKELNAMTYAERQSFRTKHPDRYEKLLRG
jgi:hypothetical protein